MKNIILKIHTKYSDNYARIKHILNDANIPHKVKARFALHCAESSMQYIDKVKYADAYAKSTRCLELVGSWLIDEASVSAKELNDAASAATASSAYYAANAANAAASSAYYAANAANAAASSSYYAANAANATASSAYYAANAANAAASYAFASASSAASAASAFASSAASFANGGGYNEQVYQQHIQRFYYYLIGLVLDYSKFVKLVLGVK